MKYRYFVKYGAIPMVYRATADSSEFIADGEWHPAQMDLEDLSDKDTTDHIEITEDEAFLEMI